MCGVSGLFNPNEKIPLTGYYIAHSRLRHRGRDGEGFFADGQFYSGDDSPVEYSTLPHIHTVSGANIVLGHRRLSIIDLSTGGHQPMQDKTGRYTMVYNGEIYNYIELRQELETYGHHFQTESDSEVLLTAFATWGVQCFNRFNGMWALAIYDSIENQLILSRDRFGIKPLYYMIVYGTLYFASEAKFLLPFLPTLQMNEPRVMEYLVHNLVDHHFETMFAGIYQIMPARYTIYNKSGLHEQSYWQLPNTQINLSLTEAKTQLQELLTSAIELRLRSDVPIGSLLSGGLDSTTIVCLVKQLLGDQQATNSFDFFSAVFNEETYSERKYIEETVKQTQMPIHWIYPNPEQLVETLPQLLYHQEFPFRSLSIYSQWEVMRQVNTTPITVLLDGQGSDEIFGGYTAHNFALIAEYIRRLNFGQAWRETNFLQEMSEIHFSKIGLSVFNQLLMFSPLKAIKSYRSIPYLNQAYRPVDGWRLNQDNIFQESLIRNLTFSALPEYLRYEDRNSMAFTLESRLPFMDYRLVEWAMSLPLNLKIHNMTSKRVLREMARPFIPSSIAKRTDKMGFVSPQILWQHNVLKPVLDETFDQDFQQIFPFLNGTVVKHMYNEYQAGNHNNWSMIWRFACLYWWHQFLWKDYKVE